MIKVVIVIEAVERKHSDEMVKMLQFIDDVGEKIAQQEAQRVQMEAEIREQIDDIHTDIK